MMETPTIEQITEQRLKTDVLHPDGPGTTTSAVTYKDQHAQYIARLKEEVDALPKKVESQADYDELEKMRKRLVKNRTGIDKARKAITEPFTKLTSEVNAYLGTGPTSGLQMQIKALEMAVEGPLKLYDDAEAEKQRKRDEEIQRRTVDRTTEILNIGAKAENDAYVLGTKRVFAADIVSMVDDTWDTIYASFKAEADAIAAKAEADAEAQRQQKEKDDRELAAAKAERVAARVEMLTYYGGYWTDENRDVFTVGGKTILKTELESWGFETWQEQFEDIKVGIDQERRRVRAGELLAMLPDGTTEYPDGSRGIGAHSATQAEMLEMDKAGTFQAWVQTLREELAEFKRKADEDGQRAEKAARVLSERTVRMTNAGAGLSNGMWSIGELSTTTEAMAEATDEEFDAMVNSYAAEYRRVELARKTATDVDMLTSSASMVRSTIAEMNLFVAKATSPNANLVLSKALHNLNEVADMLEKSRSDIK